MKLCAKCGRKWPTDGNFCPIDGSELIPIPPDAPEAPEADKAAKDKVPAAIQDPESAVDETLGDVGWDKSSSEDASKQPGPEKKGSREFSETQWFMVGADPDSLMDVKDTSDLDNLKDKYDRDSTIPTNKRKRYTLQSKEGLPASGTNKDDKDGAKA